MRNMEWHDSRVADLIAAKAAPGDCLLVNDTVTFMPAPMPPTDGGTPGRLPEAGRPDPRHRPDDDVFDGNLIPRVVV